jgi:hypothetical protein
MFKWLRKIIGNANEELYEGKSCHDMLSHNYKKGEDISCQDVIDNIYRPFPTSNLKYYPHHGLYQKVLWNGAVANAKGERPVIPCGLRRKKPEGIYVKELEYEINLNVMDHYVTLSNGKRYHSTVTFPKTTDSYLFGGVTKASNLCIDNVLEKGRALNIKCV